MAHNAYVGGSLAAWALGTPITAAKMWAFDQAQFKAINGDDGGSWAPTGTITIGGAGLSVAATFTAATTTLTGTATVNGALVVSAGSTLSGTSTLNGTTSVSGQLLSQAATFYGTHTVHGTTALNGTATVSGTTTVSGTITTTATTTLGTTSNPVNLLGRVAVPAAGASISSDFTISGVYPSVYRIESMNAAHDATLDNTSFPNGSMQIIANSSAYSLTVKDAGIGTLVTLTAGTCGIFCYISTTWRKLIAG